jgi:hypothetical protein
MATVAGVDLDRLIKAQQMIEAEAAACTDAPTADRLAELAATLERVNERLTLQLVSKQDGIYVPTGAAAKIPDVLMRQMLAFGTDMLIARTLQIPRTRVSHMRRRLGLRPLSVGGDPGLRLLSSRKWEAYWLPLLARAGYLKRVGDAA